MKKLLLLHGNRQTGQLLLGRIDKLRKKLAKELELEIVAIDAPFDGETFNTWWIREGNNYNGIDETIDLVTKTWGDNGSFVGLMGFSQGARLVHLLACLHQKEPFLHGLNFVIMASGYDAPFPTNLQRTHAIHSDALCRINIPSLHIWGGKDELVPPELSEAVVAGYSKPEVFVHNGAHHIPMKAESVRAYIAFIKKCQSGASSLEIDPEILEQQTDEIEALQAIYPDETRILENEPPLAFAITLLPSNQGIWPPEPVVVQVRFPHRYPNVSPELNLVHKNSERDFSSLETRQCLQTISTVANEESGMPCIFSCIQAARDFFESRNIAAKLPETFHDDEAKILSQDSNETDEEGYIETKDTERIPDVSDEARANSILQGLTIAQRILTSGRLIRSKGGTWALKIGLVGKPSAGKSTFFNTATGFARQRQQDSELGGAAMAPHPFTTIDPNEGFCLVPAPNDLCPMEDKTMGCTHGRDHLGRRFLPVHLKDVAGLVPGAYQGRGRGNQFLNDLTDADVILHVLDASGMADAEGNQTDAGAHPIQDMEWIRKELIEWVYTNLMRKWASVVRQGRRKLDGMFSGYGQAQGLTRRVLDEIDQYFQECEDCKSLDALDLWDQGDIYRLVSAFLGVRFPIAMALNKIDISSSMQHIRDIQDYLPKHGALVGTPVSARSEMKFVRAHMEASSRYKSPTVLTLEKDASPPFATWETLHSAIGLLKPILVFPVADFETYAPMPSLFTLATENPSLPDSGMVEVILSAGGSAPSSWNVSSKTYTAQSKPLRDALIMKQGSTVEDVFLTLKRLGALAGEFVRAEAARDVGILPKPVHKHRVLDVDVRIIKIMTTKRAKS